MKNLILLFLVVVSLISCSASRNFNNYNSDKECWDTILNITKTLNLMNDIDFYKDSVIIILCSKEKYELRIPLGILNVYLRNEKYKIRFNNLIDSLKKESNIIKFSSNYYFPPNKDKYFDIHFETLLVSGNYFIYNNMLSEYLNDVKINEIKYECYGGSSIDLYSYSTLHILYIDDFEFYKVWQIQC